MNTLGIKVLVWSSKYGDVMVAARDPEEEGRAWLYLFKLMQENDFYFDLETDADEDEVAAYESAKAGDWQGAQWLLEMRSGGEYETVEVEYITEP